MSDRLHHLVLRVPPEHPALEGHFPGAPIVPGVVLLDEVLSAAERCLGGPIAVRALKQAKFPASLLPAQEAQVEIGLAGAELRFAVTCGAAIVAQGIFAIDSESAALSSPDGRESSDREMTP